MADLGGGRSLMQRKVEVAQRRFVTSAIPHVPSEGSERRFGGISSASMRENSSQPRFGVRPIAPMLEPSVDRETLQSMNLRIK